MYTKPEPSIRDQIIRASNSSLLNVAEGLGKTSSPERKKYFTSARASVLECVAAVDILNTQFTLDKELLNRFMSSADEVSRFLYAMIKNLG